MSKSQRADAPRRLKKAAKRAALKKKQLRWHCAPKDLPFDSTASIAPSAGIVGQDTAVEALRFGIRIHAPGQNIFVRGLTGTGRMTVIRQLLEETRQTIDTSAGPLCQDHCYVHNFLQPERPRLISLPCGQAQRFRRQVDELADLVHSGLDAALDAAGIEHRQSALDQDTQNAIDGLAKPLEQSVREAGLALVTVQMGAVAKAVLLPLVDGEPAAPEKWQQLRASGQVSDEEAQRVSDLQTSFEKQLHEVMSEINRIRQQHAEASRALRAESIRMLLGEFAQRIRQAFPQDAVAAFLDELIDDAAERRVDEAPQEGSDNRRDRVHVVLSHTPGTRCPVVLENVPTLANLLGTVDRRFTRFDAEPSDHHMIRSGALLRADGGYLVVEARDILSEPGAWKVLIRTLRTGVLEIVPHELALPFAPTSLKPEAIPVRVKVILIGDPDTFHFLDAYDADFANLFKVLADFDSEIPRDQDGIAQYGAVIAGLVRKEQLLDFDRSGIAALLEHGARIAGRQDRLTTRFGRLADIAREAAFLATERAADSVTATDVTLAIRSSKRRADLPSRRFREQLADGTIRIATSGLAIGQINGLAVMQSGPLVSGFPARITASIGPGSTGVINIERESQLSGAIHTKGFYILGGLLRTLLRTVHPLAFNASLAFEQSYGGIDGDSASGAEICCLLSALTEIPLRQDLAMTGAIDQVGNILAIGSVNEKIEGFFEVCRDTGLSGTQGVIIPAANARDLMLRPDIVEACTEGSFHIYQVDRVTEALELFSGVAAGEPGAQGEYPGDTLLGVALERAFEYWLRVSPNMAAMAEAVEAQAEAEEQPQPAAPEPAASKRRKKTRKKQRKKT